MYTLHNCTDQNRDQPPAVNILIPKKSLPVKINTTQHTPRPKLMNQKSTPSQNGEEQKEPTPATPKPSKTITMLYIPPPTQRSTLKVQIKKSNKTHKT
ncbi:hypothetical protein T4A_2457 [Trichinella pseudospiralis]|uniref:Uncharacterized protein n=1 Tax=Trichinella pseudospiralis TaxID=6337 RepID=A0A0V1DZZ8_TRIPS|nr:hypothetical protein T4A_2457 [Trichinella pseudospiralis]